MRVIKPGKLPENDLFRGTCSHCKAEVECARKEGHYVLARSVRDQNYLAVDCPTCGKKIFCYPVPGGQYIPTAKREQYTWCEGRSSLASQIEAVESGHVVYR